MAGVTTIRRPHAYCRENAPGGRCERPDGRFRMPWQLPLLGVADMVRASHPEESRYGEGEGFLALI
jgi:hypothetical protein